MNINELTNIAEREKINIVNFKMKKTKARIIEYGNTCIFLDYSNIETYREEKCLLSEELGHYYYSSYYTLISDQNFINKQEYRAKKWSYCILIPYEKLKSAILNRNRYSL